jgi:hypothetical protein
VSAYIGALTSGHVHSHKIKFSFLNGNLMVPAAHVPMFYRDRELVAATDAASKQPAVTV